MNDPSYMKKPRKVIVATGIFPDCRTFPGLAQRLDNVSEFIDAMQAQCAEKYPGRCIDLVVLTEHVVTGGIAGTAADKAMVYEGDIENFFKAQAQRYRCNILVPMHFQDAGSVFFNSAIMIDRQGKNLGAYHKLWPVCQLADTSPENGVTPGNEAKVFDCDFAKVGVQICYDMSFDEGWAQLKENGAELVAWPTMSPQTMKPRMYAMNHDYWIVSSTSRNNASIFQPSTGQIHQQLLQTQPENAKENTQVVLVQEIDLSVMHLNWNADLRNGAVFADAFGDAVGFDYSEREDGGLFWSNDPQRSIGEMAEEIGQLRHLQVPQRTRALCDQERMGPIS